MTIRRPRHAFGVALLLFALAAPPRPASAALRPPDVSGTTGPASSYGIWMPAEWNGDLLLYAHGFRNPNCGLAIPMTTVCDAGASAAGLAPGDSGTPAGAERVAAWALANGYAVAASSYDGTGLALADGARRTMQLRQLFVERVGPPRRVYLFGHSMGGAIISMLAERHPGLFDGALAACGMIDGSSTQFEYMVDGRALLDVMTRRGMGLPGSVREMPPGLTFYDDVYQAIRRYFFGSEPALSWRRVSAWAAMDRVAYPAKSLPELFLGVTEFLYFQSLGEPDVLDAAHGVPATNRGTKYLGPPSVPFLAELSFDEIDAAVERVDADPQALAYAERWYEASGEISFPMLTLHTERDAAVPPRHEARFAAKVDAAGRSDLLVQRTSDRAGHCNFAPEEEIEAFRDLVSWVETGVRPAASTGTP